MKNNFIYLFIITLFLLYSGKALSAESEQKVPINIQVKIKNFNLFKNHPPYSLYIIAYKEDQTLFQNLQLTDEKNDDFDWQKFYQKFPFYFLAGKISSEITIQVHLQPEPYHMTALLKTDAKSCDIINDHGINCFPEKFDVLCEQINHNFSYSEQRKLVINCLLPTLNPWTNDEA